MRRLTYVTASLAFCLMVLMVITALHLRRPGLDISCSSWFQQENTRNDFRMTSNTLFTFTPDGAGFISMSGYVRHKGGEYHLRRDYRFTYKNVGGNKWQLNRMEVTAAGSNEVPTGLIEHNFYSTEKKEGATIIYIARIKDIPSAWVIGGLYSPAFMCVSSND